MYSFLNLERYQNWKAQKKPSDNAKQSIYVFKGDVYQGLDIESFSKKDTDLLNYILFTKESKDFYLSKNKNTHNDVIGLQEGFGLFVE